MLQSWSRVEFTLLQRHLLLGCPSGLNFAPSELQTPQTRALHSYFDGLSAGRLRSRFPVSSDCIGRIALRGFPPYSVATGREKFAKPTPGADVSNV